METREPLPNGPGAAALLAAGAGCFVLAIVAIAADRLPALAHRMMFYRPTGPLSGVTTIAVIAWLAVWIVLDLLWRRRTVNLRIVCTAALVLLALALLLTFPPLADLL